MINGRCCLKAAAKITGGSEAPMLVGKIEFSQFQNFVFVEANIRGLPHSESGSFGFHIHEGYSCGGDNFANTGGHYNPKDKPHPLHSGDMPPLLLCNGGAYLSFKTDRFRVKDIIERTVVIHSSPDDFTTQPAGNAGIKIACGAIHLA